MKFIRLFDGYRDEYSDIINLENVTTFGKCKLVDDDDTSVPKDCGIRFKMISGASLEWDVRHFSHREEVYKAIVQWLIEDCKSYKHTDSDRLMTFSFGKSKSKNVKEILKF